MEYHIKTITESCEKYKKLRFPLKIWILVNAKGNRLICWDKTKTIVRIDQKALERYLESDGSIFRCSKLSTFMWLMDFNGFEALTSDSVAVEENPDEGKHCLLFKHPSFTAENRNYFEQFLRCPKLRDVIDSQSGYCSIRQPKILQNQKSCGTIDATEDGGVAVSIAPSQLASSSFAQEKFDLMMEMKFLEQAVREAYKTLAGGTDGMVPIIEVPARYCDEITVSVPEYTRQRLIAGNYGRVDMEELKQFFGDYLPVYDDSPEALNSTKSLEIIPSSSPEPEEDPVPPNTYSETDTATQSMNTLDTFDYQEENDERENADPADHSGVLLENPVMDFVFPDEEKNLESIGENSKCRELPDDSQFKLGIEIRETFELLNEF